MYNNDAFKLLGGVNGRYDTTTCSRLIFPSRRRRLHFCFRYEMLVCNVLKAMGNVIRVRMTMSNFLFISSHIYP